MTPKELRINSILAGVFMLRMLGLFLILPILSLYAEQQPEATPLLIGLALGGYGLTQAMLQIPAGILSDRIGRKPVIVGGLLLFAFGSFIAALVPSIYGAILGRILQGAGVIAPAIMGLIADRTAEEDRARAMSLVGMGIGVAFMLSFLIAPPLGHYIGMSGVFLVCGGVALLAIAILLFGVPESPVQKEVIRWPSSDDSLSRDMWPYYTGAFCLHAILTANFMIIPSWLHDTIGITTARHGLIYFAAMVLSLLPCFLLLWRRRRLAESHTIMLAIVLLAVVEGLFILVAHHPFSAIIMLALFFTAFNLLEALLPAAFSKRIDRNRRGAAMGVFSTWQFLGAFAGGIAGGIILPAWGRRGTFYFLAALALLWAIGFCVNERHLIFRLAAKKNH